MSRTMELISLFVASPSDVVDERRSVRKVVDELNLTLAAGRSQQLEVVGWETHVHPALSSDPQQAINTQLSDNYDFVVAIFWTRIGTPTPRAMSGTLEEIERAIARWNNDPASVEVMVYFKNDGAPISDLDAGQLQKVQDFRSSLSDRGVLYKQFSGNDFESIFRTDLSHALAQRAPVVAPPSQSAPSPTTLPSASELEGSADLLVDDDAGYEDLLAEAVTDMTQTSAVMDRIRLLSQAIAEKQNERNNLLGDPARRREALEATADDLRQFSISLTQEATQFSFFQERAFAALAKSIVLASEDGAISSKDNEGLQRQIEQTSNSIKEFSDTVGQTRIILSNLPRAIRSLNVAKRTAISALDLLRSKLDSSVRIQDTIVAALRNAGLQRPIGIS